MLNLLRNKIVLVAGILLVIGISLFVVSQLLFSAPQPKVEKVELFTIALKTEESDVIGKLLGS